MGKHSIFPHSDIDGKLMFDLFNRLLTNICKVHSTTFRKGIESLLCKFSEEKCKCIFLCEWQIDLFLKSPLLSLSYNYAVGTMNLRIQIVKTYHTNKGIRRHQVMFFNLFSEIPGLFVMPGAPVTLA